jgi:hypothetical protein
VSICLESLSDRTDEKRKEKGKPPREITEMKEYQEEEVRKRGGLEHLKEEWKRKKRLTCEKRAEIK